MSRRKTVDEVRRDFIDHVRRMVRYWANPNNAWGDSTAERLAGLAHSILAMIDGCAGGMPYFAVVPDAHPEDRPYRVENEEDYYPCREQDTDWAEQDIAGGLHEELYRGGWRP